MGHHSWDEVLLPPLYSYGFTGGPGWNTKITALDGGGEQRLQFESDPKWRWSALRRNFKDIAGNPIDVTELVDFYLARRGAQYGFMFVDPNHYNTTPTGRAAVTTANDQVIGVGDGTTTRFSLRVQRLATGDISGRAYVHEVLPLHNVTNAALARLVGVSEATVFQCAAAAAGTPDLSATFSAATGEVIFATTPANGEQITWGGYYAVPARFSETTDQQLDATVAGFLADDAPFEVESISNDERVPYMPGGTPFGAERHAAATSPLQRWPGHGFLQQVDITGAATRQFHLWDPASTPTGGPFMLFDNISGTGTLEVIDHLGAVVGSIDAGDNRLLYLGIDGSVPPVKKWYLLP